MLGMFWLLFWGEEGFGSSSPCAVFNLPGCIHNPCLKSVTVGSVSVLSTQGFKQKLCHGELE